MNYKQMLDKIEELERRVTMLEQGQHKHTEFPGAPQFTPAWSPHNPYQVTCKGLQ
jgi:hypothetical protein